MKRLFVLPAVLFLFGCATNPAPKPIGEPIVMKCKAPEVPPADLETIPKNATYSQKLQIILNNCLKIKKENELLREAIKVCQ